MWQIICVTGFIITAQNSNQNNQVSSTINNASTNDSNSNSISSSSSSNSDSGYIGESAAKSSARGYFDEYSLEHVMPKKWRNNWDANKLDDFQAEKRDKILLTLGNLTLLTKQLNSIIRDADWQTKKNGNQKNHGLNEYAQGIEIFSKYLKRDTWDENTITERAQ